MDSGEKIIGIDFFHLLVDEQETSLEKTSCIPFWSWKSSSKTYQVKRVFILAEEQKKGRGVDALLTFLRKMPSASMILGYQSVDSILGGNYFT